MCRVPGVEMWAGDRSAPEEVQALSSVGSGAWALEPGLWDGLILTT